MAERIGTSWKQHPAEGSFDAIVVGSGIGGLAAAAVLARRRRMRVLVLERHYTAGGFTQTFERKGYEWDVGVHYIGQLHPSSATRRVFDYVTGGRLEWARMPDVYNRIVVGERTFDLVAGEDRFVETLAASFPGEERALRRYLSAVKRCTRATRPYFTAKVLPPGIGRLFGGLLRSGLLRWARRTTREVLEETIRDPLLRAVLAGQYGDYGLPPSLSSFAIHAMVAAHYLEGAFYPVGGASRFAATMVPVIEEAGGKVMVLAEVDRVLVEGGRAAGVRLADGSEVRAAAVVSDVGWANTVGRLVPDEWRARFPSKDGLRPSGGHLALYLGLSGTDAELGLSGTNLWIYGDADLDGTYERYLRDPASPFPFVYVSFPSAKDPAFASRCPGRSTIDVLAPAPFEHYARWAGARWSHRGEDYEALKARMTERLLAVVEARLPQNQGARRGGGAVHAAVHPPLHRPPAGGGLRARADPAAVRAGPAGPHSAARALPCRAGRRDAGRDRGAHGRRPGGVRGAAGELARRDPAGLTSSASARTRSAQAQRAGDPLAR